MITPPFNISASPALTRKVATSRMCRSLAASSARPRRAIRCCSRPPRESRGGAELTATAPASGAGHRGLLQPEGLDAVVVLRGVLRIHAVGERLDEAQQRGVGAHVGGAVGGVVE